MKNQQKQRVFVGLSGGVDSAVSAALLKGQGYDVTGVFIKAWTPEWMECTWKEDRRSAMRVCAVLNIPFITLDLEKEYKEEVVDYMIREYKAGRTPNPDVMCNKEIKFGAFLKYALAQGADFIATGHYARKVPMSDIGNYRCPTWVKWGLAEARDKNKDQSYFLWTLTEEQLKHILFPIGNLEKSEVRKLAEKFNLPQATRKDSQGLCFLGQVDMKEFLKHYIESKRGNVLNEEGKVIGYHNGAFFFTLGERHGFTIVEKTDKDEPLYVVAKNIEENTITVAPRNFFNEKTTPQKFEVLRAPWDLPEELQCRFRYRQAKISCTLLKENGKMYVRLKKNNEIPASGQSVVFYNREICFGGAIVA